MSSINLERACDATASSGYSNKWTFSAWVKRGLIGTEQGLFANKRTDNNSNSRFRFRIKSTNKLCWEIKDSTANDDSSFESNMLFRDTNAWYHIVLIYDTDNSTATERIKCYVNGQDLRTELGGFSSDNQASSGFGSLWSSNVKNYLGVTHDNSGNPYRWDGLMSHVHFTYGYRYEASTFGSTDSTTGEWKINTSPSVTYGSQGFHLFKDNASVTDQSGEGNNYTLNAGTLTKTEDNPSNVFATWNPLVPDAGSTGLYHGNTQHNVDTANWRSAFSTLGMTTGKYYFEANKQAGSHGMIGIRGVEQCDGSLAGNNDHVGVVSQGWGLYNDDGVVKNNNSDVGSSIGTYANGDYMGCFLDCDNSKLYFSKNGTIMNTTGYSITAGLTYMFGVSGHSTYRWVCNFGNGAFGSTQLTGTTYNGSDGNGIFKYNPNNITLDGSSKSFKSLSTKGLNE